jgi:hypothetical protein
MVDNHRLSGERTLALRSRTGLDMIAYRRAMSPAASIAGARSVAIVSWLT